jgi:hypothetical protein
MSAIGGRPHDRFAGNHPHGFCYFFIFYFLKDVRSTAGQQKACAGRAALSRAKRHPPVALLLSLARCSMA